MAVCTLRNWTLVKGVATLKELQVVCGGFVYTAMFRRPLLGALNEVWRHMQTIKHNQPKKPTSIPWSVRAEIARFICLMPLAQMEFRAQPCEQVTCSDASTLGGGVCVSEGLTSYGVSAANSEVRGDIPEEHDMIQVPTVGLFDGIAALRVAADVLGLPVAAHISVERDPKCRRVVESWFPDSLFFEDIVDFGDEQIKELALRFSNVGLILVGAGPPCQGVSGLNADKKGAIKDCRSSLFQEVPRVEGRLASAVTSPGLKFIGSWNQWLPCLLKIGRSWPLLWGTFPIGSIHLDWLCAIGLASTGWLGNWRRARER